MMSGKARSSLNTVQTGLTGRTSLLADKDEAAAYRAHVERFLAYWREEAERQRRQ